jgi:prevent-host-death family protein
MRTVTAADVEADLDTFLDDVAQGPIVITRDGRPIAALVPLEDQEDAERLSLAHNPDFRRLLDEARERVGRTGGMSEEEFWRAVDAKYGTEDERTLTPDT